MIVHRRRAWYSRHCICGLRWRQRRGCLDTRPIRPAWMDTPTDVFPPIERTRVWRQTRGAG